MELKDLKPTTYDVKGGSPTSRMNSDLPAWITAFAGAIAIISRLVIDPLISVTISGIVIIVCCLFVIIGHTFSVEPLYEWFGQASGMATETAILLIVIGAGKITLAYYVRMLRKRCDEQDIQIDMLQKRKTPAPHKLK